MISLQFAKSQEEPLRVLCLGAHSDDIEIGCGGTVLKMLSTHPNCVVRWVVLGASGEREKEARESADSFLEVPHERERLRSRRLMTVSFPTSGPRSSRSSSASSKRSIRILC